MIDLHIHIGHTRRFIGCFKATKDLIGCLRHTPHLMTTDTFVITL
jgi:hypothetical protein